MDRLPYAAFCSHVVGIYVFELLSLLFLRLKKEKKSLLLLVVLVVIAAGTGTGTTSSTPINLLLQHNAVDAGLEECEHQARLALELAQAVEDLAGRRAGECVEDRGELIKTSSHITLVSAFK